MVAFLNSICLYVYTQYVFVSFLINRFVKICYSNKIYEKIYRNKNVAAMVIVVIAVPYATESLAAMNVGGFCL